MKLRSQLRRFTRVFSFLLLIASVSLARCGKEKSENVPPGPPIDEIAAATISKGVGSVLAVNDAGAARIVVFDETHASRIGQVEIATMLVRLHDRYGMRRMALEGEFFANGPLNVKWFHSLGQGDASRAAALRLLREGEIGACEFVAIALPDVQVTGSETAEEYNVMLSDAGSEAPIGYLLAIAEKSLSQDQIREANTLIQQDRKEDALKYMLNANDWTRERYAKLGDRSLIMSAEDQIALLRELEAKASESSAQVDAEMQQGLADAVKFYEMAVTRTGTMVKNAISLAGDGSGGIVAMNVGAAHTPALIEALKKAGATFAVIRPASLTAHEEHGGLSMAAFSRKQRLESVDARGLGGYLDGRNHKPRSVLGKGWFHSKAEIYHASALIAAAVANGGEPPFDDIASTLAAYDSIVIDKKSFAVVDDHGHKSVIFKVSARIDDDDPSKTVELWVKALKSPPVPPGKPPGVDGVAGPIDDDHSNEKSLEAWLIDERDELKKEETREEKKGEADAPRERVLLSIAKDTKAVFARSREDAMGAAI